MKKLLSISLALLLIAALMVPAFAANAPLLADDADLLSSEEESIILKKLTQTSDALDMDIVIVTTADVAGKSLRDYADDYYDDNGFGVGRQGDSSGVLLLVYDNGNGTERWISTRGYGIEAFTDYGIQYVGSRLAPLMDSGAWQEAFEKYIELSDTLVKQAKAGNPLDNTKAKSKNVLMGIVISLVVGLIIGFIVMNAVKKKYKPVHFKANATDYLVGGSLQVTGASDNFRTTAVTRTPIQSNSGRGGSSTHTSSSGASHGGGGF